MNEAQSKTTLNVLLDSIDAPRALVILVDDDGGIETADKGLGLENTMMVCFSLAYAISQQIKADRNIPDIPRNGKRPLIHLPPHVLRKLDDL